MPAGTYIGWVGHENLGDEAMWQACRLIFPQIHWRALRHPVAVGEFVGRASKDFPYLLRTLGDELTHGRRSRRIAAALYQKAYKAFAGEVAILGGGTIINEGTRDTLETYKKVRQRIGRPVPVFGPGVHPPEIWPEEERQQLDHRRDWVEAFRELPVVGVRGPRSKELLDDAGARNVQVVGDSAVLFHQPWSPGEEKSEPRQAKRIGINCGRSSWHWKWGEPGTVSAELAKMAAFLVREGHQVELFAVWPDDLDGCREVAKAAGLDAEAVAPLLSEVGAFLQRVKTYDFVIALKLHAGILAAAANVPFVMLEYSPKCQDFALSIGWQDRTLRTSELAGQRFREMVLRALGELSILRTELCSQLCVLSQRFKNYCNEIKPLLVP